MNRATRPALLGGSAVRTRPFRPQQSFGPEERAAVLEVMDSGVLSQFLGEAGPDFHGGPQVRRTEAAYAEHFRARFAVTTNSATTALHVAVAACGLGPGDEVIVSPFTMSASATAILMQNAIPVFADIDPETFCLDPAGVRARITPQTRAIMAVDIFGQPAHWDPLRALAQEHGLRLIEDAAQAAHATAHGRFAGTLGDAGVLSLNYHKIIHSGEGGVLLTDDPEVAQRAQMVRNHGEVVAEQCGLPDIANTFGSNYRMTEIEASIARTGPRWPST
jgi:dTDP-4-amino-4,6-dideoxygalactose transaminase